MEDNDPRITKHRPNHTHQCVLCNMTLSLSWTDNKNSYCKENGNYQSSQIMRHLTKEYSDLSDIAATAAMSKSKIETKKEGIKRNLLSSYENEEKDTNKILK